MVALRDVSFRYRAGEFELRIGALELARGEQAGLIGPSGSGKTTLLHLVAGIERPEGGRIVVDGTALSELSDASARAFRVRKLGLVFQEFALLEHLDAVDNVLLPYRITPTLRLDAAVRDRARSLIESVGLAAAADRLVTYLSQGERQRVAVCRALVTEPSLLLADEPTANLDPANKFRVIDILRNYAEEHGAALLTVTHDHDLLGRFPRVIDIESIHSEPAHSGHTRGVAS
jgi:putative ABC transport system ATP-binding protein